MSDPSRSSSWCLKINMVGYQQLVFFLVLIKTVYNILKSLIQNKHKRIKGSSAQWITKSRCVTEKASKHENLKHPRSAVDLLVSGYCKLCKLILIFAIWILKCSIIQIRIMALKLSASVSTDLFYGKK